MSGPWTVLRERQQTDPVAYQAVRAVQYGVDPDEALAMALRIYSDSAHASQATIARLVGRVPLAPIVMPTVAHDELAGPGAGGPEHPTG